MSVELLAALRPPTTPCLVVLGPVLENNLAVMQGRCDAAGIGLRAHAKMHKCTQIARRQIELGAVGVCAQTAGEAAAMVQGGVEDVLVTSPPPPHEAERLCGLAARSRISVVVDDLHTAQALSAAASLLGERLRVLVDVDLGQHRTGVPLSEAAPFVEALAGLGGVRVVGLQGYLGHLQHIKAGAERSGANARALERLAGLAGGLRAAGRPIEVVTGGGTGTHAQDLTGAVFTELQAGSYALMDVEYGACDPQGEAEWPFRPALFLAASVVSARHPSHVTIDAGIKALSTDGPAARVVAGAPQGALYRTMGDEHGALFHPSALKGLAGARDPLAFEAAVATMDTELAWPADAPKVGDLVWLQPGHCDPTINLHDGFYLAGADATLARVRVDARRTLF